jgi:uncharacterized protein
MTQGDDDNAATPGVDPRLKRDGGISYLHLPATDVRVAAVFYREVFGWNVTNVDSERPSFDDGTGHVSGAWMTDQEISREPGLLPYIYVDDIDETVARIPAHGGEIVKPLSPEGNLLIATFRDPSGNTLGVWHDGPR